MAEAIEVRQVKGGPFAAQYGLTPPVGSPEYNAIMDLHAKPANADLILPAQSVNLPAPASLVVSGGAGDRRVFITCGRGDTFVIAVEEGPEWEAVYQSKYDLQTVRAILPIIRALGVRLLDRTGGELAVATLEQEDD